MTIFFFFRKFFSSYRLRQFSTEIRRFGVDFGFFNFLRKLSQKFSQNFFLTGRNVGFGFELSTTNYKLANETKNLTFSQIFSIFDFFFLNFRFSGWGIRVRLLAKAR